MSKRKESSFRWAVWPWWVLSSAVGGGVGFALGLAVAETASWILARPVFEAVVYGILGTSVAILQSIFRWGEFLWPLMVTRGESFRPLPVAIQQFFSQDPKVWGDIFAFASMITIPLLIIFLLFQKWFVRSVASSGIKG